MSINPALLVSNSAAATDEEADWVEGEDNIFTVECLKDVSVQDQLKLGIPLKDWGPEGDRYEIRYLVKWKGYEDPSEDTWEPRRNLDSWQDSYDDDLRRIAARDPQKADLDAMQAAADRKNAAWRQKEAAKAQKKLAKKSAKKSAHTPKVVEYAQPTKGKKVTKDKEQHVKDESVGPSVPRPRLRHGSVSSRASASPAPDGTSRAARSSRRSALAGEAIDQEALNEFIESNAPRNVRNLRFTPPPKHDEFGNLIQSSSDTEDSQPATGAQTTGGPVQASAVNVGFAGDSEEEDLEPPANAMQHQQGIQPGAALAVPHVGVGFAGSDDENDGEQPPAGPTSEGNAAPPVAQVDLSVSSRSETAESKPVLVGALSGGFAGDSDEEDVPTAHASTAVAPAGFASNSDDEGDGDAYFPDLAAQTAPQVSGGFAGDSDEEMDAAPLGASAPRAGSLPTTATTSAPVVRDVSGPGSVTTQLGGTEGGSTPSLVSQTGTAVGPASATHVRPLADETPAAQATTELSLKGAAIAPSSRPISVEPSTSSEGAKAFEPSSNAAPPKLIERREPASAEPLTSTASRAESVSASGTVLSPKSAPTILPEERAVVSDRVISQMSPPPVPRRPASRLSPEKTSAAADDSSTATRRLSEGPSRNASPLLSEPAGASTDHRRRSSSATVDQARASSAGAAPSEPDSQRLEGKKRRATDDLQDRRDRDFPEDPTGTLKGLKIRKKAGDTAAAASSPVEIQRPSPAFSGESDSRSSGQAPKAHDPFNHGRARTTVKNGFITINADSLRQKNLVQTIAPQKNMWYPEEVVNSQDVEIARIKYIWSVGKDFGNPLQGSDTFDDVMLSPHGLDIWIAAPPPENQAGRDKAARSQVNDYLALQLLVSSYGNVRQADSPRASVRAVFVHRSKLEELGATTSKYAELEHLRANSSVRFYAYGNWNGKRFLAQIWRTASALTFSPAALVRQAARLKKIVERAEQSCDSATQTADVFPWLPIQYVMPNGPLDPQQDGGNEKERAVRDRARVDILSLLVQDELALVNFAPLADHEPSMYQAFPSGPDRVLYGGPEQALFQALSQFRLALDLNSLQKFICLWRNRYPIIRRWVIVCTQEEMAAAKTSQLPGIELVTGPDLNKLLHL